MIGRLLGSLASVAGSIWRGSIGRLLPDACRFTPSCSHYAAEVVQRRGVIVGVPLAIWRLLRCNPLSRGGYDPVSRSSPPCRRGRSVS